MVICTYPQIHPQAMLVVCQREATVECIHNIFLLFARQKMVLVIVSCWLAPLQSRSEWVLFSFRSCESDAFPPCLGITAKHVHRNPSCSSVCQMIILLQRVCPGLLYLFFLFVTLVYVRCDGDIGIDDVGRRHNIYWVKTSHFRFSEWSQTPRESFSLAPVLSAQCCLSCCSAVELWPSPVVPLVFLTVY